MATADGGEDLKRLQEIRAQRAQAYREQHRGFFYVEDASQRGLLTRALLWIFLVPFWILAVIVSLVRRALTVLAAVASMSLSMIVRPQFWLGGCVAAAILVGVAMSHCREVAPGPRQVITVVCASDDPRMLQARDAVLFVLSARATLLASVQRYAQLSADAVQRAAPALVELVFGPRCPFEGLEGAQAWCAEQSALRNVKTAADCGALRRTYHEGQRHFHPDHLRLRLPVCDTEILEACSIALNLALEQRRRELNCPGR